MLSLGELRGMIVKRRLVRCCDVPRLAADHRGLVAGLRVVRPRGRCAAQNQAKEEDDSQKIFHDLR